MSAMLTLASQRTRADSNGLERSVEDRCAFQVLRYKSNPYIFGAFAFCQRCALIACVGRAINLLRVFRQDAQTKRLTRTGEPDCARRNHGARTRRLGLEREEDGEEQESETPAKRRQI